jgi:hypothetical protein
MKAARLCNAAAHFHGPSAWPCQGHVEGARAGCFGPPTVFSRIDCEAVCPALAAQSTAPFLHGILVDRRTRTRAGGCGRTGLIFLKPPGAGLLAGSCRGARQHDGYGVIRVHALSLHMGAFAPTHGSSEGRTPGQLLLYGVVSEGRHRMGCSVSTTRAAAAAEDAFRLLGAGCVGQSVGYATLSVQGELSG